jgi:hypothetical protein
MSAPWFGLWVERGGSGPLPQIDYRAMPLDLPADTVRAHEVCRHIVNLTVNASWLAMHTTSKRLLSWSALWEEYADHLPTKEAHDDLS